MVRKENIKGSVASLILVMILMLGMGACTGQQSESEMMQEPQDSDITSAVVDELTITRGVNPDQISVTTEDGIVTLGGTADKLLSKKRAESVASATKGVRSIVNNIEVLNGRPNDAIASDVENALLEDPATDIWEIESSVENGVVTLTGTVNSWHEKELASNVASGVDGVSGIVNNITVEYQGDRPDVEIENEIESAMAWNVRLDDGLIDVSVADGIVDLNGTVGSLFEKNLAITLSHVAGVEEVNSSALEIDSSQRDAMERKDFLVDKSDDDIAEAIMAALERHPRVNAENVNVEVDNNVASLTGTVTNLKAARAAAQVASDTRGVISTDKDLAVENKIVVTPDINNTDEEIRQDVEEAFARDPYLSEIEIETYVEDGVVTLGGQTNTYFEKYQADDVASTVNGVTDIINNIEVDYPELTYEPMFYDWDVIHDDYDYEPVVIEDEQLEDAIYQQFVWSPFVDIENVNVDVENGVATLNGTVATANAVAEASEEAYEAGAEEVINNLEFN